MRIYGALWNSYWAIEFIVQGIAILLIDLALRFRAALQHRGGRVPSKSFWHWWRHCIVDECIMHPSTEIISRIASKGLEPPPVAVVTGANSGIGFEVSLVLARAGMRVVLACRNELRGQQAVRSLTEQLHNGRGGIHPFDKSPVFVFMQCDLTDFSSVKLFAAKVAKMTGCCGGINHKLGLLKLLVVNAGVQSVEYSVTVDGFEKQFQANYLGHALLVDHLLPSLHRDGPSRIVCVSSACAKTGSICPKLFQECKMHHDHHVVDVCPTHNRFQAYRDSKLAMVCFANRWAAAEQKRAAKLRSPPRVIINSLHPGCAATHIVANSNLPLNQLLSKLNHLVQITVEESAAYVVALCLSPQLDGGRINGEYFYMSEQSSMPSVACREVYADSSGVQQADRSATMDAAAYVEAETRRVMKEHCHAS